MFNKKLIFTVLLLFNFHMPQLKTGPGASCLQPMNHTQNNIPNPMQNQNPANRGSQPVIESQITPGKPLVGERSDSKIVPQYFEFKQSQIKSINSNEEDRTLTALPDDLKYVIGQYVGFDQRIGKRSFSPPFDFAIKHKDLNAIQVLVALKADWHNEQCEYEFHTTRPLCDAIQGYASALCYPESPHKAKQCLTIVDYLLRKKIGINNPEGCRKTPMHVAVDRALVDVTQRLITAQANLTLRDHWNRTPLDNAKKRAMNPFHSERRKKFYKICSILEQAHAPSSIILKPMPTDAIMQQELYDAELIHRMDLLQEKLGRNPFG